jgi:hypothetical protein
MSLLARHHGSDAPVAATDEIARSLAVDAVDDALRRTTGRGRFTAIEATRILDRVRAEVDETVLGPEATRALDDAAGVPGEDSLVEADRLTDSLLDLRLALRG